jgi:hypothetical protein
VLDRLQDTSADVHNSDAHTMGLLQNTEVHSRSWAELLACVPCDNTACSGTCCTISCAAGGTVHVQGLQQRTWWVGPSSPRPMESCVMTKMTPASDRADMRMAPRM